METFRCADLGDTATAAAERFRDAFLPQIVARLAGGEDVAVVLPRAGTDHTDWRRALVRDLARAHTPARVNFTTTGDEGDEDKILAYLAVAPGVTGQYLPLYHA